MRIFEEIEEGKYLICRPQGGLNDCLCQIEYCRKISKRNSRSLIIQTEIGNKNRENRFQEPFGELFNFVSNDLKILSPSALLSDSNSDKSVNPKVLYPVKKNINISLSEATNGKIEVFKLSKYRKLTSDIEIHESWGGGLASANLMRHIELNKQILQIFRSALSKFPDQFIGVHFRNSDHKSTYQLLFEEIKKIKKNEKIILFSDNFDYYKILKTEFPKKNIFKSEEFLSDSILQLSATKLALIELLIMSKAKYLVLIPLKKVPNGPKFSGFSRLAKHLWVVNTIQSKKYRDFMASTQPLKGLAGFKNPLVNFIYLFLYELPRIIFQSKFPRGLYKQI